MNVFVIQTNHLAALPEGSVIRQALNTPGYGSRCLAYGLEKNGVYYGGTLFRLIKPVVMEINAEYHDLLKGPMASEFIRAALSVRGNIEKMYTALNLLRVQCVCKASDRKAVRWAEFWGLYPEGVLRKYMNDGTDGIMLARIF